MSEEAQQGDIIIVKRGGGGGDGHHGGVWKIAFADFMTAMMAFFLVMWLINASDEDTKKAVASYFNPIELMDITTNPKGLSNPKYGVKKLPTENPDNDDKKATAEVDQKTKSEKGGYYDEQALFKDPIALLNEIVGGVSDDTTKKGMTKADQAEGAEIAVLSGGEQFQDPFDPASWKKHLKLDGEAAVEKQAIEDEIDSQVSELDAADNSGLLAKKNDFRDFEVNAGVLESADAEAQHDKKMQEEREPDEATGDALDGQNQNKELMKLGIDKTSKTAAIINEEMVFDDDVGKMLEEKIEEINRKLSASPETNLNLELVEKEGGYLVTLSERASSGMFNIGSARPTRQLVLVMEEIGSVLSTIEGKLTISGHTDGRQYKNRNYDNWRLSTDRAHMAYYMLIKGGVLKQSVEKIEGHADAKLRVLENPNASENRRIEVFISRS